MIKRIGLLIVFIASFFGAKYLVQYAMIEDQEAEAIKAVNQVFSEMESEADTYSADTPRSVALNEIAVKKAAENINSQTSPVKKRQTALSTFMGFYLVNHRTRSDFCNDLGVNISTFSDEFKRLHQTEVDLAMQSLFKTAGEVEKLYGVLTRQLEKVIRQDMADIASAYDLTLNGACELMEDNGMEFAAELMLSKVQPTVYSAIHGKQ